MSKTEATEEAEFVVQQFKQDEALSQNQIRARQQHRLRGRFISDPSRPGNSASTTERLIRLERQRHKQACERNVSQLVAAVMCKGGRFDYVPSSADGPLSAIVNMVLKPQFRVPTRMIPAIARQVYLDRTERKTVPRRNIVKNGEIVKRRVTVFSTMRFPTTDAPQSLMRLFDLLIQMKEADMLQDDSVQVCMERLNTVFNSYDASKCEYEGYPPDHEQKEDVEVDRDEDEQVDCDHSIDYYSERTDTTDIEIVDTPMQQQH